jgi:hypothetical protein
LSHIFLDIPLVMIYMLDIDSTKESLWIHPCKSNLFIYRAFSYYNTNEPVHIHRIYMRALKINKELIITGPPDER